MLHFVAGGIVRHDVYTAGATLVLRKQYNKLTAFVARVIIAQ